MLLQTKSDWAVLVLRLTVGIIMFPHGAQKMLGTFGGYGFKPTMQFFTQSVGLPWVFALAVILIEFFAPIGLILGLGTRICAFALAIVMVGAIATTCYQNGFFMNWYGSQKGEGYEYHLLVIGLCLALLVAGAGRYAIDNLFHATH
ncbi:DoxX family protein [Dyadobacter sp. CY326]|uniref:DoxX family protein n=1 Tax=Dyadobacter sp. CY326 TaxID=2907300 RepID=UPI001F3C8734|nr:DoxX family protein [Dyadobacter sp. CY326]MCE7066987.1 DoxX family protein [Dyadobacter sp. CY326]